MSWDAWIQAGGAIVGGLLGNKGNKDAAEAGNQATQAGIDEQRRQFDITQQNQAPWLEAGQGALANLAKLNAGDMSGFYESPDYQFALDQGLQARDRSAASRGGLFSGGHQADLLKFGQGLASQNYGDYYNRQAAMAGVGQTAANNLGSFGQNTANSLSDLYNQQGRNRQSSYLNNAAIWGNTAGQLAGIAGDYYGGNGNTWGGGWGGV